MTWETLLAFNLALFAALLSPGPAFLLMVRNTLSSGRSAGIITGLGLGTVAAFWTLLAVLGLEVVFRIFPFAFWTMKIAGACYLFWIAYGIWNSARDPLETSIMPTKNILHQAVAMQLLNPKSVLFAAAVIVVIFPQGLTVLGGAIIVVNHLIVEILFYTIMAFAMSQANVRDTFIKAKVIFDRFAAVVLASFGLKLIFGR